MYHNAIFSDQFLCSCIRLSKFTWFLIKNYLTIYEYIPAVGPGNQPRNYHVNEHVTYTIMMGFSKQIEGDSAYCCTCRLNSELSNYCVRARVVTGIHVHIHLPLKAEYLHEPTCLGYETVATNICNKCSLLRTVETH